jgi:hypothetical protein
MVEIRPSDRSMYAVGIGCVWFASREAKSLDDPFANYEPFSFLDKIKNALEGLDSVSNFNIEKPHNSVSTQSISLNKYFEDENYFPLYSNVDICFDILIPQRTQEHYMSRYTHALDGIELFHVRIIYDTGLPVLFIYYSVKGGRDSVNFYSPSNSVVFIRKYLSDRLGNNADIEFCMLGPSPFHADFFLISGKPLSDGDDYTIEDLTAFRGYRTLVFYSEESDILDHFVKQTEPTFSAFYGSVRETNHGYKLYYGLMTGIDELLRRTPGFFSRFAYWFRSKQRIDGLYELFVRMKEQNIASKGYLNKLYDDETILSKSVIFRFIEERFESDVALTHRGYKNYP